MRIVSSYLLLLRFDSHECAESALHEGVSFRLGCVYRKMSLYEFGWRCGLYSNEDELKNGL